MTMEAVNALDRSAFIRGIGWVFEHSPWVAEQAWAKRPFESADSLHGVMVDEVERGSRDEQLALLRAHPDLGTRAKVSDASKEEQANAGLDQLTQEEFERLQKLNAAYRDKFGFPFLFAVKGSNKFDILEALEQRYHCSPEQEFRVALEQVYRIARFRLDEVVF
jgi:2-oxo-4-hydroxy-4-carboxy-5-ureidoimidazoline decarboxylase